MASYFIFGAVGECPACSDHRFSGPAMLATDTQVTCHKCGHTCSVAAAVETALKFGGVKKLSDHRIVSDGWVNDAACGSRTNQTSTEDVMAKGQMRSNKEKKKPKQNKDKTKGAATSPFPAAPMPGKPVTPGYGKKG
jgi:hypothetical protein